MSLCSMWLRVGMVFVSENGTMYAHRMWETKDYSCCVTDKRTGKQTDWVTYVSSLSPQTELDSSNTILVSYPQVHPSRNRKL